MIEDELRATFAAHEHLVPDASPIMATLHRDGQRRHTRRVVLRAGVAAATVAVAPAVVGKLWPTEPTGDRSPPASDRTPPASDRTPPPGGPPLNLLLVGLGRQEDAESWSAADEPGFACLVHLPGRRSELFLLPLDLRLKVDIPAGPGGAYPSEVSVLGKVFGYGYRDAEVSGAGYADQRARGAALMGLVVTELLGLTIDATMTMHASGFQVLGDALGERQIRSCDERPKVSAASPNPVCPAIARVMEMLDRPGKPDHYAKIVGAVATQLLTEGVFTSTASMENWAGKLEPYLTVDGGREKASTWSTALEQIKADQVRVLTLPSGGPDRPGVSLAPLAAAAFGAARTDTLGAFVAGHASLASD